MNLGKFSKDTSYCPDIHLWTILTIPNKKFRRTVPSSGNIISKLVSRNFKR